MLADQVAAVATAVQTKADKVSMPVLSPLPGPSAASRSDSPRSHPTKSPRGKQQSGMAAVQQSSSEDPSYSHGVSFHLAEVSGMPDGQEPDSSGSATTQTHGQQQQQQQQEESTSQRQPLLQQQEQQQQQRSASQQPAALSATTSNVHELMAQASEVAKLQAKFSSRPSSIPPVQASWQN